MRDSEGWNSPFAAMPGERSVLVQDSILDLLDMPECIQTAIELLGARVGDRLKLYAPIGGLPAPPVSLRSTRCYEAEITREAGAVFDSQAVGSGDVGDLVWANKVLTTGSQMRIVSVGTEISALVGEASMVDRIVSSRPQEFIDYAAEWLDSQNFLGKSISYRVVYSPERHRLFRAINKAETNRTPTRPLLSRFAGFGTKWDFKKVFESMYPEYPTSK